MKIAKELSKLIQAFFSERMIVEMNASPHTWASYSMTFQLLLGYAKKKLNKTSSQLTLGDLNHKFIRNFLNYLEQDRKIKPQSLNVRLAAIRSFFHYIEPLLPEYSALIKQVLSIEDKRTDVQLVDYLNEKEIEALLKAPDQSTWIGRRDHCLLAITIQTGLRLSEVLSIKWSDVVLGEHAYIHCMGKGRKERDTMLSKQSVKILSTWSKEVSSLPTDIVFPCIKGSQMSSDAFQYLVRKYTAIAGRSCPSLMSKKVTPHVLRHTAAMKLLHAKAGLPGIALWLGHENIRTTHRYLNADIALKEEILNHINPLKTKTSRYHPTDKTMVFLKNISKLEKNSEIK